MKSKKQNILLCQESNTSTNSVEAVAEETKIKLQYHQAIWTQHGGIINFNKALNRIWKKLKYPGMGEWYLRSFSSSTTQFLHRITSWTSIPTQVRDRNQLCKRTVEILMATPELIPDFIMAGNFNFSFDSITRHATRIRTGPEALIDFINGCMKDCINQKGERHDYTCIQKRNDRTFLPKIDYVFAGANTQENKRWWCENL